MLNFEPHLGPQYWSGGLGAPVLVQGHDFTNLESTIANDACIVISQTVAL